MAKGGRKFLPGIQVVRRELFWKDAPSEIPTTFVPLSPEKIILNQTADLLVGVFHIMWSDMPRPRTYPLCLQDVISASGEYLGTKLRCGNPGKDLFGDLET